MEIKRIINYFPNKNTSLIAWEIYFFGFNVSLNCYSHAYIMFTNILLYLLLLYYNVTNIFLMFIVMSFYVNIFIKNVSLLNNI